MALDRFNRNWTAEDKDQFDPFYLDLIAHRDVSNAIAADTGVEHQSPQVLLIENGKVVFSETHQAIRLEHFREKAAAKN
jgi:bacillithiol system protein YtxJ